MSSSRYKILFCLACFLLDLVDCQHSENLNSALFSRSKCEALLMDYAVLAANFTECFIRHARPVTVCQNCINTYLNVIESYKNITKLKDEATGEACKLELINVDRLEVIEGNYKYVTQGWERAFCNKCFHSTNGTELNSNTKKILELQNQTQHCIETQRDKEMVCNSSSTVCANCVADYRLLNDYYDSHESYNGFCMDIIDMMNTTRYNWSSILCCCTDRRKREPYYLFVYIGVFTIPVIFYVAIWFSSTSALRQFIHYGRWRGQMDSRSSART